MVTKRSIESRSSEHDKNGNSNSTYCIRTPSRGRKDSMKIFLDHFAFDHFDLILLSSNNRSNEQDTKLFLPVFINLYKIILVSRPTYFK